MAHPNTDIIQRLQKDILSLQGFKTAYNNSDIDTGLGIIKNAFPNKIFPTGVVHELISSGPEDAAVTCGFVAGLLSSLLNKKGAAIWISQSLKIYPPALKLFGIDPDKIIFILPKEKEMLWVMEEALKCDGLSAVIGEIPELNFTASRRLQLAVEKSRVTGFILRNDPKLINTTTCVTRWKITSMSSQFSGDMPGVGSPSWNVELLKVRNGTPGKWQIEFSGGRFKLLSKLTAITLENQKKTA
ncbi:MAG: ImuA family protein [Ginsengibacter sp.]